MTFLRDAWYPAAWVEEVTDKPHARTILETPIVFYRLADGTAVALSDTCPHRFAPLHMGKVDADAIVCPYHGLRFGADGRCVHNPHGGISSTLKIKSYPLAERYGLHWIWMGAGAADHHALHALNEFDEDGLVWVHGTINVAANYQLVIDNLLDLSHVEFMHPFLGAPGASTRMRYEAKADENVVYSNSYLDNEPTSPLFRMLWTDAPDVSRFAAKMRWMAPANLILRTDVTNVGHDLDDPVLRLPTAHLLTPVNENTTRYFWAAARNVALNDENLSQMMRSGIEAAFQMEDEPMIAAVQERMTALGLQVGSEAYFKTDSAAVQARRIVNRLIASEVPAV